MQSEFATGQSGPCVTHVDVFRTTPGNNKQADTLLSEQTLRLSSNTTIGGVQSAVTAPGAVCGHCPWCSLRSLPLSSSVSSLLVSPSSPLSSLLQNIQGAAKKHPDDNAVLHNRLNVSLRSCPQLFGRFLTAINLY